MNSETEKLDSQPKGEPISVKEEEEFKGLNMDKRGEAMEVGEDVSVSSVSESSAPVVSSVLGPCNIV